MASAAGVDTWSVAWYVDPDSPARRALDALATQPAARSKLIPESISGYRVGLFPGPSMVYAEGHPDPEGLCPPNRLPGEFERLVGVLADCGIEVPRGRSLPARRLPRPGDDGSWEVRRAGEAGVRRLDLTADLAFDSGAEGLAALAGVAAMPLPRIATSLQRQPGGRAVETVYLKGPGGRRVLGRWYDKGVESGTAERGRLIRPEDQRRWDGRARLPVEALGAPVARELFQRRFLPLWKATKGITVGTSPELLRRLADLVEAGEVSGYQAERLLGYLFAQENGVDDWLSTATTYRRKAECRELGLVLADGVVDQVEVDLHDVLEAALEAEDWYGE